MCTESLQILGFVILLYVSVLMTSGEVGNRSSSHAARPPARWVSVAALSQLQWFLGNVYELVVDVPRLLVDAHPNREPRLLRPGSPVRYYLPAAPVTLAAITATLTDSWRAGGDRRVIAAAAASTASSVGLTVYPVRSVNLRLLRRGNLLSAIEADTLVKRWHRANVVRAFVLVVSGWAVRRAARATDPAEPIG